MKNVIVSLKNVTKDFPSGEGILHVLKGIDLDIYQNEFVVIYGESGCGKSTLINIIGGMDTLTGGEMFIEGKDFSHVTEQELTDFRRKYVGFIFQTYNLLPNLTAKENVRFIADLVDDAMDAGDAIDKVGLTDHAKYFPGQLSGGQQQRVCIARAIVKKPRLILADEPTAALDYATSIGVLSVIENIVKTLGTTVVMVTHNAEIARMADRIVKISDGRIAGITQNTQPLSAAELSW